jgi:hypothetical protein
LHLCLQHSLLSWEFRLKCCVYYSPLQVYDMSPQSDPPRLALTVLSEEFNAWRCSSSDHPIVLSVLFLFSNIPLRILFSCNLKIWFSLKNVRGSFTATPTQAWNVFSRLNTEIVGSNPTQGIDVCLRLFCVLSCVYRGLALAWSTVQGVLPTV